MYSVEARRALAHTLEQASVGVIDPEQLVWLAYADADEAQNKAVHYKTNQVLLDLLPSGDFGVCIHVTGEMRALLDPLHRQICSEMYRRRGTAFSVLHYVPDEHRNDRDSVIRWSISRWSAKGTNNWDEQLRTFDVIGERSVDVRVGNTLNQIQYSVFGNKYILLQEKHRDTARAKRLWLLESRALNEALVERAQSLIRDSRDIDPSWYRSFLISLSGVASRLVLQKLIQGSAVDSEDLLQTNVLTHFGGPRGAISALSAIDFVDHDAHGALRITSRGREYLNLLSQP